METWTGSDCARMIIMIVIVININRILYYTIIIMIVIIININKIPYCVNS